MANIYHNLISLTAEIAEIAELRSPQVKLIAVSKNFAISTIREAYAAGQCCFGESYAQELAFKAQQLSALKLEWHFIGKLQSNKTRLIAQYASWVHALTTQQHALRLNNQRPPNLAPLQVLISVNISNEVSKNGLQDFNAIKNLAAEINHLPRLQLRGLMGIASANATAASLRQQFMLLSNYSQQLQSHGYKLDQLSIGMSDDYPIALECGATMLRIGSKIFGARSYAKN